MNICTQVSRPQSQIHWKELPGNKYLKKINRSMLSSQGSVEEQEIKPIGEKDKRTIHVVYDREYVLAKLQLSFLNSLEIESLSELVELLEKNELQTQPC